MVQCWHSTYQNKPCTQTNNTALLLGFSHTRRLCARMIHGSAGLRTVFSCSSQCKIRVSLSSWRFGSISNFFPLESQKQVTDCPSFVLDMTSGRSRDQFRCFPACIKKNYYSVLNIKFSYILYIKHCQEDLNKSLPLFYYILKFLSTFGLT